MTLWGLIKTLFFPIVAAFAGAYFTNKFNKRKPKELLNIIEDNVDFFAISNGEFAKKIYDNECYWCQILNCE